MIFMAVLSAICTCLSFCLPPFLLSAGIYFLLRLSGFPLVRSRCALCGLFRGSDTASRRALFLSLAGTLGIGNIAGVGVALAVGGEGAVFWLFIGGIVATVLKYAEVTLSLDARPRGQKSRGALDYIAPSLGRFAALLFAALTLVLSLLMGSVLQGSVIRAAASDVLPIRPVSLAIGLFTVTFLLFIGGRRTVESATAIAIPILTILYCLLAITIIIINVASLPSVVLRILCGAFSLRSTGGGLLGIGLARSLRAGIGKGLFSNEAGAGTAPFAHGNAPVHPARQGLYGVLEVAIDTLFMCTLTALSVLSVFDPLPTLSGTALISAAFASVFGRAAGTLVSLSVILFSYATVACWVSYGQVALSHLSDARPLRRIYALAFCAALTLGVFLGEGSAFLFCDVVLSAMTFINVTALLKNTTRIRRLTEEYLLLTEERKG